MCIIRIILLYLKVNSICDNNNVVCMKIIETYSLYKCDAITQYNRSEREKACD